MTAARASSWPVPTRRAVVIAALGLLPAVLSVLAPSVALACVVLDLTLVAAVALDFLRAPRADRLRVTRTIDPVLSSNRPAFVDLALELAPGVTGLVRGEVRDGVPPGPHVEGHRQAFALESQLTLRYRLEPKTRGELVFEAVFLRLEGPWGLCARQQAVALPQTVKVFPDLTALTKDALALARASEDDSRRRVPLKSEGREFESLREYRAGDDRRTIDWKATARRSRAMVRVHQPERNQAVLLLLDCGRHMAGEIGGRRKLDLAIDAALRVAKVSLDQGDHVGVMAFATAVKGWLPPRKGAEQLRAIAQALHRVEASLEESDYGGAIDLAFSRNVKRTLVVLMTDLTDPDAAQALLRRTQRLVPRHLPLVASMQDDDVHAAATAMPERVLDAHRRRVAAQLEADARATVARLRDAGARVVRTSPKTFGPAAVNAYLDIKAKGLL
ncbi:MAG: DUF58 domain-containing protein [Myxococcaceae bacterium]|jgi:uncharacterized protein (DUF58 family)|nr:DUF58 domain-containing protein [Myxococcaceae bacterium]